MLSTFLQTGTKSPFKSTVLAGYVLHLEWMEQHNMWGQDEKEVREGNYGLGSWGVGGEG